MLDNTTSHSIVAGLRGAEQAQRLVNPAGWARQALENVTAPKARITVEGRKPSIHARAVDTVTALRNNKVSKFVSKAADSVVGSGVHAPLGVSLKARTIYNPRNLKPQDHETCLASLQSRFEAMVANPSSVGALGLGVGLVQFIPAALGGIAASAIGATVGGVADGVYKLGAKITGKQVNSNMSRTAASWGAYLGTGAGVLAAATILPVAISTPILAGASLVFWAPNFALQALRGINTAARACVLGATYSAALVGHAVADSASFVAGRVKNLRPAARGGVVFHDATNTTVAADAAKTKSTDSADTTVAADAAKTKSSDSANTTGAANAAKTKNTYSAKITDVTDAEDANDAERASTTDADAEVEVTPILPKPIEASQTQAA